MKDIELGISVYNDTLRLDFKQEIRLAQKMGAGYIFTSLHIPEEDPLIVKENLLLLLAQLKDLQIKVVADISQETLKNWGLKDLDDLSVIGVDFWRLDYGFPIEEVARLSKSCGLTLNASTLNREYLEKLKALGADFTNLTACHNFYPKPFSGLSMSYLLNQNALCHEFHLRVMSFVAGDQEKRGPLEKGLPSVEETRSDRPLLAALKLLFEGQTDIVILGDPGCSDECALDLAALREGRLNLRAQLSAEGAFLYNLVQEERKDSSPFLIRSLAFRGYAQTGQKIPAHKKAASGQKGSIRQSNEKYGRYSGDVEILRVDLPDDDKQNQLGFIHPQDLCLLPYVRGGMSFSLIKN